MTKPLENLPDKSELVASKTPLSGQNPDTHHSPHDKRAAAMKDLDNMWRAIPKEHQADPPLSTEEVQDIIRSVRAKKRT